MHEIVGSHDNKFVYIIGNVLNTDWIYKFECIKTITNCSWIKIPTQLRYGRWDAVAMAIPNALSDKLCSAPDQTTTTEPINPTTT